MASTSRSLLRRKFLSIVSVENLAGGLERYVGYWWQTPLYYRCGVSLGKCEEEAAILYATHPQDFRWGCSLAAVRQPISFERWLAYAHLNPYGKGTEGIDWGDRPILTLFMVRIDRHYWNMGKSLKSACRLD
jgi:hypothetical protein